MMTFETAAQTANVTSLLALHYDTQRSELAANGNVWTHVDGIQYLHGSFASIVFVQHLVDFSVGPFPDGLDDFPGVSGIRKVVKDNRFP